MTLSTSFSLEELDYLKGLPEVRCATHEETTERSYDSWARIDRAINAWDWWALHRDCDIFGHRHGEFTYFRHGDMLAKRITCDGYLSDSDVDELKGWLAACHAPEMAAKS